MKKEGLISGHEQEGNRALKIREEFKQMVSSRVANTFVVLVEGREDLLNAVRDYTPRQIGVILDILGEDLAIAEFGRMSFERVQSCQAKDGIREVDPVEVKFRNELRKAGVRNATKCMKMISGLSQEIQSRYFNGSMN